MSSQQASPHLVPSSQFLATVLGVGATALGAVDTAIIRYTAANITDASGAFTVVEDANTGCALTCVRPGVWAIELYAGINGAALLNIGISLNAADAGAMSGPPIDFVAVDGAAGSMGYIAVGGDLLATSILKSQVSRIIRLVPGDIIRFGATVGVTLDADNSRFFMTKIGD